MAKTITLQYPAVCADCKADLPVGAKARWYGRGRVYGIGCHAAPPGHAPRNVVRRLDDDGDDRSMFADPGGNSALRAASRSNPRNLPCPTCERPNMLTPADRARHYQCDGCADRDEGLSY